jgi:hypothetical protein
MRRVGKEVLVTLPPDGAARGPRLPHYNRIMEGECSSHDKVSPMDGGATVKNQPPLRAAWCSPRRITDASLCSTSHLRA